MSGYWSITNRGILGAAATATLAAAAAATDGGQVNRLRSLTGTLSGGSAGTDLLVVRDGPSGSGTIIWQSDLSVAANGTASIFMTNMDLRASPGNALTIEFVSGVASDRESVNAEGDYVPLGYPMFLP